jgi:hypothetical protein
MVGGFRGVVSGVGRMVGRVIGMGGSGDSTIVGSVRWLVVSVGWEVGW